MVGTLVSGCRYATFWCDLELTFDPAVVTLKNKILSGLYLGNHKVLEVDPWYGHWLGGVGVHRRGVTLICPFDLAVVTLTYKISSGLHLRNRRGRKLILGRGIG